MRIIVISDTHGNVKAIESVLLRNEDADWIFFLGDGERDLDTFLLLHPKYTERVIAVCGNCDACSMNPGYFILPVPGHRIFATHGHYYAVKNSLELLKMKAKDMFCDIILFGHTHVRYNSFEDDVYIMNPGSASSPHDGTKPSFGHIDISEAGVVINIADISYVPTGGIVKPPLPNQGGTSSHGGPYGHYGYHT